MAHDWHRLAAYGLARHAARDRRRAAWGVLLKLAKLALFLLAWALVSSAVLHLGGGYGAVLVAILAPLARPGGHA